MKHPLYLTCASTLLGLCSAAQAQIVLIDTSFAYTGDAQTLELTQTPNPAGTNGDVWGRTGASGFTFWSANDYDGSGGSIKAPTTFDGGYLMMAAPLQTGVTYDWELTMSMGATDIAGSRFMFASTASSTNNGFGLNFDVKTDINDGLRFWDIYARVGTTSDAGAVLPSIKSPTIKLFGTLVSTDGTNGTLTVNYNNGSTIQTITRTAAHAALGDHIVYRNRDFYFDGVSLTSTVPEPSTYALLLGLGAVLWTIRRRQ